MQGLAVDGGIGSNRIMNEVGSFAEQKACNIMRASRKEKCGLSLHVYDLGNRARSRGSAERVPECGFSIVRT